jgi:hypothetical protein
MSQTIVPAPAPAALPDVGLTAAPSGRLERARAALGKWLEGSPGRLRVVAIGAVLAALVLALGGGWSLERRSSALDDAARASGHLVLLQTVQTELQQVEADATNSFLSYGLEPQAQRLDYQATLAQASQDLTTASQYSADDARALGAANAALVQYSGDVEAARANNRQGLQVGNDYLNDAGSALNDSILPALHTRVLADQKTVDDAFSRAGDARWFLLLFAIVGLGGLLAAQYYLAVHSRRFLNLPLVGATVLALVAVLIGAAAMAYAQAHGNSVRSGQLTAATDVSTARLDAFDAKSIESLTLINQGTATAADADWTGKLDAAQRALPSGYTAARDALAAYAVVHRTKINKLDVAGNNTDAITEATLTSKGSANAQFAVFAAQTARAPQQLADDATSGLKHARVALLPAAILLLLAGLLAAAGAWYGVSLRLDEYR